MQLSPRIIKAKQMNINATTANIQTELRVEHIIETIQTVNPERDAFYEDKVRMARFLKEAEEEKIAIVEVAKQEATDIRACAEAEGFKSGEEQGQEAGFQRGYQTGLEAAKHETDQMKAAAQAMLAQAAEEVNAYYITKREEIISLAAEMAEKVIHEKLNMSDERILTLIEPILSRMEQESKFITLTVTPELVAFMKEKTAALEQTFPLYRFAVLVDPSLDSNGCVIESSNVIIDVQVEKQLAAMVEELKGLTVN